MNWSIPTGVICIELEGQREDYDGLCRTMLTDRGFKFKSRLHVSEFWYKPDYFRAGLLFDPARRMQMDSFEPLFFTEEWRAALRKNFY